MAENKVTETTRAIVAKLYDCFRADEWDGLAVMLDDDIDWSIEMSGELMPFCGPRRSPQQVVEALKGLKSALEHVKYEQVFTIIEGERASVYLRAIVRDRQSGRATAIDLCDLLQIKEGKLVWYREFLDTLSAAEQMAGGRARFG